MEDNEALFELLVDYTLMVSGVEVVLMGLGVEHDPHTEVGLILLVVEIVSAEHD